MSFKLTTASSVSWRNLKKRSPLVGETLLDLAPLVDIIFTLIIFFMLTSPFVTQWGIKVTLPELKNITPVTTSEIEITVTADNQVLIKGEAVDETTLRHHLNIFASENKPVAIISDTRAQLGKVLEVRDIAIESGIKQLNLRAKVKSKR